MCNQVKVLITLLLNVAVTFTQDIDRKFNLKTHYFKPIKVLKCESGAPQIHSIDAVGFSRRLWTSQTAADATDCRRTPQKALRTPQTAADAADNGDMLVED